MKAHIASESQRVEVVCGLVFLAEGSRLDRRLVYDGSENLLRMTHEALLCWASLPVVAYPEALEIVRASFDQLNAIRRDVASSWVGQV